MQRTTAPPPERARTNKSIIEAKTTPQMLYLLALNVDMLVRLHARVGLEGRTRRRLYERRLETVLELVDELARRVTEDPVKA